MLQYIQTTEEKIVQVFTQLKLGWEDRALTRIDHTYNSEPPNSDSSSRVRIWLTQKVTHFYSGEKLQ